MICVNLATASETGAKGVSCTHSYSRFGFSDVRSDNSYSNHTVVLPLRINSTHTVRSLFKDYKASEASLALQSLVC